MQVTNFESSNPYAIPTTMHYYILPHQLTFKFPAGTSRGVYTHRKVWYVFLSESPLTEECCKGILEDPRLLTTHSIGVGEIAPLHDLSCEYKRNFHDTILQCCQTYAQNGDMEVLRHYPSIYFGIETAKLSLQSPDGTTLFNTPFSQGEAGIPINGLVWMGDKETMRERMLEKIATGYNCVKLKIGALQIDSEMELLRELRQIAPSQKLQIRVDANGAFTENEALSIMEKLAELEVHSIEQPIRSGNWESMSRLCKESPIPIALDEELIGVNSVKMKQNLLQEVSPAYIVLKPTLHGGLNGCKEWIKIANNLNIGYWITSALESNIGLNAIAQFTSTLPQNNFAQGLGTGQLFVENIPHIGLTIRGNKLYRNPKNN